MHGIVVVINSAHQISTSIATEAFYLYTHTHTLIYVQVHTAEITIYAALWISAAALCGSDIHQLDLISSAEPAADLLSCELSLKTFLLT